MPRKAKELGALAVANLKPVESASGRMRTRFMVGGADGLHLRIAGASKSWILRVMVGGVRRDIGLGSYPGVTLATARKLANAHRDRVAQGGDPIAERRAKADKGKTFRACAEAYIASRCSEWKNPKHASQWSSTLEAYAYPVFGSVPVDAIDTAFVLKAVEPIWAAKTETASRLRGRIEKVLGWATFRGYRSGENPARWKDHLDHHLPSPGDVRKIKHHASLPYPELPAFVAELRQRTGMAARALEFAILCVSRSGEVRQAVWSEIDMDRRTWTIPAERMKAKREHVVPLSDGALSILRGLPKRKVDPGAAVEFVFPAPHGSSFSDAVFQALFKRMGRSDLTQHGFRSTFREWAGEMSNYPREVIEHALAHQLADKAEAAYQRGSLLPKRVLLMSAWSNYCEGRSA
ncbi:tyrosine-type recombinase/integrase [Sphingomonas sp. CFBP 13720]|uniref:tyrosine-type recombinase/integrase n=1 Tax=Sphingomonas sp. CFBP 13720 TaxID=2775302 RepID=UPI001787624A|nr:site-specific integrase [Sphingomonas sp. CFBP 13720]MBD8679267.1 tyrosine-type recombinase/integrase [Sphingomonas sp. CFBP 13720]